MPARRPSWQSRAGEAARADIFLCAGSARRGRCHPIIILGKSLAAFGIVLAFGYPISTALTASACLAQMGEFSVILAGLGMLLGLLPPEGRDLILAGALLSITLNPLVFAVADRIGTWLRARPGLIDRLERRGDDLLSSLPEDAGRRSDHAVIVAMVGSAASSATG